MMQFLVYGTEQNPETSAPPSAEQMAEMGKFMEEALKAGVVISTGGLQPTGTRIRLSGGQLTVTDGPFIEAKELIAGFAIIEVSSREEAIGWASRFRKILGEGESEIVQVFGPA
jgi:hypothetical protein